MSYVNLHCHTTFSALDGQMLVADYLARVKALGQTHAAITDHGTMAGTPEFLAEARKVGIVPIIGMEAYVQPESRLRKHQQKDNFHLTMLAVNRAGYDNLSKLATAANSDGFYYKPRVDWELLERYNEGIVVLSGCASGELAKAILRDDELRQQEILDFYTSVFPGRYYLEFQDHGDWADQQVINRRLVEIAQWTGLPRVATNDAHFCVASDFPAQQLLVAINRKQDLKDVVSGSSTNFVRDNELMASLFDGDMLRSTLEIAAMVETYPIGDRSPKLPASPLEVPGQDPLTTMAMLARDGLERRLGVPFGDIPTEYMDRFQYEIEVIADLTRKVGVDFGRYLLIIADICNFARHAGVRYGPRGSAAGSVINWALGFSEPDPVKHGLVFERFLNPYRKEMPDVDIDFADSRRAEVFGYIRDTYGHVAKIGTYSMFGNKQSIRDASKTIRGAFSDHAWVTEQLVRLVPHDPRPGGIPLRELVHDPVKGEPIRERMEDDPEIAELIEGAMSIEGRQRGDGMHAAGVVISDRPLEDMLPLSWTNDQRDPKKGDVIPFRTQYEMQHLESLGLLKIDILGLKTLSTLEMTLERIERDYGAFMVPDLWKLDWEDRPTWDLIKSGRTLGLFQIGSDGLGGACFQVKPDSLADLALTGALYRPGPMKSLQTIIDRKRGNEPVESIHPAIDPLLAETYGVPVYQEQIMGIAQAFAGYDLGQADLLRKAMGKKIREKMAEEWQKFLAGSLANGHSEEEARTVWDFIEPFADYGFNRAHAVCYAYVAFQTAYLKTHFPLQFYASALTIEAGPGGDGTPQQRIGSLVREATQAGIVIEPPDIAHPVEWFEVDGDCIRYGLVPLRDASEDDIAAIIRNGPFASMEELILRGGIRSGKTLLAMAGVGALDALGRGLNRRTLIESAIPMLKEYRTFVNKKKYTKQASLFDTESLIDPFDWDKVPRLPEYPVAKLLEMEQKTTGMFRTPLPRVDVTVTGCLEAQELEGWNVNMLGVLTKVNHAVAKKSGQTMGYATLLDETGQIELVFFHRTYEEVKQHLREGSLVMVTGRLQTSFRGERNMIVDTLGLIEDQSPTQTPAQETIRVNVGGTPPEAARELGRIFDEAKRYPGNIRCDVVYGQEVHTVWIGSKARVGIPSSSSSALPTEVITASR